MTHKRFCLATLALLGLATLLVYLCGAALKPFRQLSDEEYLANLRENSEFGPATFLERRARVLVIGDSHAYAAFDYLELARELGTTSISACAMGGLYADSLPLIAGVMREQGYAPEVILYGFSPRQLFEGRNKKAQLEQHARALRPQGLPGLREAARNLWTALVLRLDRPRALAAWPGRQDAAWAANSGPIEALAAHAPGRRAAEARLPALATWDGIIGAARIAGGQARNLEALCALAAETGAELYVVEIPESPELAARYPEALRAQVDEAAAPLAACARKAALLPAGAWGLGDQHFVNRSLAYGYDYARWADPAFRPAAGDFDPDHMNLVGARRFTRAVAGLLRSSSAALRR